MCQCASKQDPRPICYVRWIVSALPGQGELSCPEHGATERLWHWLLIWGQKHPHTLSAKCNYVTGNLWECLRVVGPESQCGQIPEFTGPMQWPLGGPGSAWERRQHDWEHRPQAWEHLGAPTTSLGASGSTDHKPGSAGNTPGSTSNHCRVVWEKHHLLWKHWWCVWKW